MRTAVIDIGTNTLLLLIVDEKLQSVMDLCQFGRLGEGLDATGSLTAVAIDRSLAICREYRKRIVEAGATTTIVIGTQALREATNSAEFIGPAQEILGAPIEVIAGTREAALAFAAVARTFPELAGAPYLVVDVGGGSTELISTDGTRVESAVSIPIGAVRLTERHLKHDPPAPAEVAALIADIDAHLANLSLPTGVPIVGTAGTATTMAAAAKRLEAYDPAAVTGVRLEPMAIDHQLARLLQATISQRRQMKGIEPERADVIAGGVAIFARVVHKVDAPVLITCDRGIRWGVAYECSAGPR
jgi:exopolyphosphatase/guanosine-5'-triphosphate,3'-diphosphate pyrophosphatase